jgi:hypothetical protein
MMPPEESNWRVLVPFDIREAIDVRKAAVRAGKSESTMRQWCKQRGLGRRVGDGNFFVSQVALAMYLDGNKPALAAYHSGDRSSALVKDYFDRFDLPLPKTISATSAVSATSAGMA